MPLLPLAANWHAGQPPTAAGENALAAAVNALGAGTLTIPEFPLLSNASALALTTARSVYIYYGTGTAIWSLPGISTTAKWRLLLISRGSGSVTVQRTGTNMISKNGTLITTFALMRGVPVQLINDGTYWVAL